MAHGKEPQARSVNLPAISGAVPSSDTEIAMLLVLPIACVLLALAAGAASGDTWPQYPANPFVIRTDAPAHDGSEGAVVVADLTGDGSLDYLLTRPGYLGAYSHDGRKLWSRAVPVRVTPQSENNGLPGHHGPGVQAGDVDGDGKAEAVFLTTAGELHIVDGATGADKATARLDAPDSAEAWEMVVIANLRGRGDRDLILQATNAEGYRMGRHLAAYPAERLDEAPLWTTGEYVGCAHGGIRLADLDGDGRDEILGATVLDEDGAVHDVVPLRGHLDSIFVADVLPERPGLEIVALEEGGDEGNRVVLYDQTALIWEAHYEHQEPQNAAVGRFDPARPGLQVWCRSRYDEHQRPFVFDAQGRLIAHWRMDDVAPEGWTAKGVEVIWTIDWTGEPKQLAAAKERHTSGDVAIFDPITGRFLARFPERADRLYVADVSGDWREELVVVSGPEIRIYHNPAPNPDPDRPRLWAQQHYRRSKMTWNYYSP